MKKYSVFLFLILLLFSCKDSSEDVIEATYPVVISVKNLSGILPGSKNALTFNSVDSLLNKFGVINFLVFDATGKFVRHKKQVKEDKPFGEISDELKVGQYTVVLLASTGEISVGTNLTTLAVTKISSLAASGDIFYKKISINVTSQGVKESLFLDRMTGCVVVKIEDRITDNIKKVELQVENETPYFNINTAEVDLITKEERLVAEIVTASNRDSFDLGLLLINNQIPIIANLRFLDASNKLIVAKRLPAITNIRGHWVSAEGKLSEFASAGFTIGYNSTWLDTIVVRF